MLSLKAYGLNEGKLIIPDAIIYLKRFKRDVADKNLNWALEFWDNSREAQLTDNKNNCLNCEYQTECQTIK